MRRITTLALAIALLAGCEQRTEVKLEGGNSPTFILSGSGRLGEVLIFGPEHDTSPHSDPFDETYVIWKIEAEGEGEAGAARLKDLKKITYGVIPNGYRQVKPTSGPPPALITGKRYDYQFVTVNAPWGAGYFELREGKAVSVQGP